MRKKKKTALRMQTLLAIILITLLLSVLGIHLPEHGNNILDIFTQEQSYSTTTTDSTSTNPGPQEHGKATFTSQELLDTSKGWITYGDLDSLGRAMQANALLKPSMVNTGTPANKDLRPPGFISGLAPNYHSRGHLIGRQLGGTGDNMRNLTTLYQNPVNTPFMTKYENQVRQALDNGETIRYRVTPIYDSTDLMCKQIDIEAKGLNKNSTIDFYVTILNQQ